MSAYFKTFAIVTILAISLCSCNATDSHAGKKVALEWITTSEDGSGFVLAGSGAKFLAWGVNYDHGDSGRLLEDYWNTEWPTVVGDFKEIKALGANTVRIHLQTAKFMQTPTEPNQASLDRLARLVELAEETGLYIDVTGLGCYHKKTCRIGTIKWMKAPAGTSSPDSGNRSPKPVPGVPQFFVTTL